MPFEISSPIGTIEVLMIKGEKGDTGASGNYNELTNKPTIGGVVITGSVNTADLGAEVVANKVTQIASTNTNAQYPSALAVWNLVMGAIGGSY